MCVCVLQLLTEGMCAKHDLDLADFTPHADTQPEEEEEGGEEEGEKLTIDTGIFICQSVFRFAYCKAASVIITEASSC